MNLNSLLARLGDPTLRASRMTWSAGALLSDKPQQHTESNAPSAAGLAIVAANTGRVLLQQRTNEAVHDDGSINAAPGMWEFPGGNAEDADGGDLFRTARREWEEETGLVLPPGVLTGSWTTPGGVYVGYTWQVPDEESVHLNLDGADRHVINPDDPDGDHIEVMAWWDPTKLARNPVVREELRRGTDFAKLRVCAVGEVREFVELLSFVDVSSEARDDHGRWTGGSGDWEGQVERLPDHQQEAVMEYQAGGQYEDINDHLRGKSARPLSAYLQKSVEDLDGALSGSKAPVDSHVYRGLTGDVVRQLKVGATIRDGGFSSTSLDQKIAEAYGEGGAILDIKVRAGQNALYSPYVDAMGDQQHEVILPRGSSFKITGQHRAGAHTVFEATYE